MSEELPAGVPQPQSNKKLLLVLLVFNVLSLGAVGFQVVMGQSQSHHAAATKQPDKSGKSAAAGRTFGPIVEVGTLVANLNGPGSGHYLKVSLHVEAADEEAKARIEAALVPIRSDALQHLAGFQVGTGSQAQLQELSKGLKERIAKLVGQKALRAVYISEFVVQ